MSQAEFKFKNDYPAFLASNPSPQEVVDFLVYLEGLPNLTIQDAEAGIAACDKVKEQSTYITKLGYNYDSQFIVYEGLFRIAQNDVFEKSWESFQKTIETGLEAAATLSPYNEDGTRMALRTQLLLRYPDHFGYPQSFKDLEKADEIKKARFDQEYFSEQQCFEHFVKHDINQAVGYTIKGWRSHYYCQLYINKDPEAAEYFKRLYDESPRDNIIAAVNYIHGMQHINREDARNFAIKLQKFVKEEADAEGFTRWARMDLKVHSHINGFDVIPWVIAGPDEPSVYDIENSLRHCDMGIQKINSMKIGAYEYRNKVFLYETKGWIYTHLQEKTYENYCNALKSYQEALKLYVNVENYHEMLQFALSRYSGIAKEALILFTSPGHFDFSNSFKAEQGTEQIHKEYMQMVSAQSKGFPYQKRLKLIFQLGQEMNLIKDVDNKIFQEKQSSLVDFIVDESDKPEDNQTKVRVARIIDQYKAEAEILSEILADNKLNAYYEAFIDTFLGSYDLAIKVIQDRQVRTLKAEVPIKITAFLSKIVPLIGDQIIASPAKLLELVVSAQTKTRGSHISKIAPNQSKLNSLVQSLTIKVIEMQTVEIKQLSYRSKKVQKKHLDICQQVLDKIGSVEENLYNQTELFGSIEMETGNRHATILIDKVIATGSTAKLGSSEATAKIDLIVKYMKENPKEFELSTLLKADSETLKPDTKSPEQNPTQNQNVASTGHPKAEAGCGCLVYSVQIVYDNAMLNHIQLLNGAFKRFGIKTTLSALDQLGQQLVKDAFESKDPELVEAGVLSLQQIGQ